MQPPRPFLLPKIKRCVYCERMLGSCVCLATQNDVRDADEFYAELKARLDERAPA